MEWISGKKSASVRPNQVSTGSIKPLPAKKRPAPGVGGGTALSGETYHGISGLSVPGKKIKVAGGAGATSRGATRRVAKKKTIAGVGSVQAAKLQMSMATPKCFDDMQQRDEGVAAVGVDTSAVATTTCNLQNQEKEQAEKELSSLRLLDSGSGASVAAETMMTAGNVLSSKTDTAGTSSQYQHHDLSSASQSFEPGTTNEL